MTTTDLTLLEGVVASIESPADRDLAMETLIPQLIAASLPAFNERGWELWRGLDARTAVVVLSEAAKRGATREALHEVAVKALEHWEGNRPPQLAGFALWVHRDVEASGLRAVPDIQKSSAIMAALEFGWPEQPQAAVTVITQELTQVGDRDRALYAALERFEDRPLADVRAITDAIQSAGMKLAALSLVGPKGNATERFDLALTARELATEAGFEPVTGLFELQVLGVEALCAPVDDEFMTTLERVLRGVEDRLMERGMVWRVAAVTSARSGVNAWRHVLAGILKDRTLKKDHAMRAHLAFEAIDAIAQVGDSDRRSAALSDAVDATKQMRYPAVSSAALARIAQLCGTIPNRSAAPWLDALERHLKQVAADPEAFNYVGDSARMIVLAGHIERAEAMASLFQDPMQEAMWRIALLRYGSARAIG